MRIPLVAGNWKMNGSRASVQELLTGVMAGVRDVSRTEVAVCPPYVFLPAAQAMLEGTSIRWGAQNLSTESAGAFTGEVAASMLKEFGCHYVIVGHSERRTLYGEDDQTVARKFAMARETLQEREQGVTEAVVARQLDAVLDLEGVAGLAAGVIAYEPVWAIGTGVTATPEQAQEVHAFIRGRVTAKDLGVADGLRILYGGSMKPDNAAELMAKADIDGGLIGGASLKASDFLAICRAAGASAQ
jgi:triosephosphate isomerase